MAWGAGYGEYRRGNNNPFVDLFSGYVGGLASRQKAERDQLTMEAARQARAQQMNSYMAASKTAIENGLAMEYPDVPRGQWTHEQQSRYIAQNHPELAREMVDYYNLPMNEHLREAAGKGERLKGNLNFNFTPQGIALTQQQGEKGVGDDPERIGVHTNNATTAKNDPVTLKSPLETMQWTLTNTAVASGDYGLSFTPWQARTNIAVAGDPTGAMAQEYRSGSGLGAQPAYTDEDVYADTAASMGFTGAPGEPAPGYGAEATQQAQVAETAVPEEPVTAINETPGAAVDFGTRRPADFDESIGKVRQSMQSGLTRMLGGTPDPDMTFEKAKGIIADRKAYVAEKVGEAPNREDYVNHNKFIAANRAYNKKAKAAEREFFDKREAGEPTTTAAPEPMALTPETQPAAEAPPVTTAAEVTQLPPEQIAAKADETTTVSPAEVTQAHTESVRQAIATGNKRVDYFTGTAGGRAALALAANTHKIGGFDDAESISNFINNGTLPVGTTKSGLESALKNIRKDSKATRKDSLSDSFIMAGMDEKDYPITYATARDLDRRYGDRLTAQLAAYGRDAGYWGDTEEAANQSSIAVAKVLAAIARSRGENRLSEGERLSVMEHLSGERYKDGFFASMVGGDNAPYFNMLRASDLDTRTVEAIEQGVKDARIGVTSGR